ncbi:hypothetical protein TNCV_3478671 [Trichonephila clavipes]|nr:hypothetical protein TNCV_3478671 [Trichonephila clavipes]
MRNKEDILIKDLLLEEMAKELLEQREFLRNDAKRTSKPCSLKIERRITEEERKLRYTKKRWCLNDFTPASHKPPKLGERAAPLKLVALSDINVEMRPLQAHSLFKAAINASIVKSVTASK